MNMITVSSPGKIILFGEHAVVYDKLGIACSIDKRCKVKVFSCSGKAVFIKSRNLNLEYSLEKKELIELGSVIDDLKAKSGFDEMKKIFKRNELIPSFYIISKIFKKYDCFEPINIEIDSEVPKNLGSSSSAFSSLAFGVLKFLQKDFSTKQVSDFAYYGDIIAHGGTPSGIDNSTVSYGGYVIYRKSEGIKPLKIDFEIPLLIVDSGEKSKTAEMVSYIREQKNKNSNFVNSVLNSLNNISTQALKSLEQKEFVFLGKLMTQYYNKLKKLNISTLKLDKIIKLALNNDALGAKPTGAWGGGCCLVLAKDEKDIARLKDSFEQNGFSAFKAKIGVKGVKTI